MDTSNASKKENRGNRALYYDFVTTDFTVRPRTIAIICDKIACAWCFQQEKKDKDIYYRGRIKLRVKERIAKVVEMLEDIGGVPSITIKANRIVKFYDIDNIHIHGGHWRDGNILSQIPTIIEPETVLQPWEEYIIEDVRRTTSTTGINIISNTESRYGQEFLSLACSLAKINIVRIVWCREDIRNLYEVVTTTNFSNAYMIIAPQLLDDITMTRFFTMIYQVKVGKLTGKLVDSMTEVLDEPHIWVWLGRDSTARWNDPPRWIVQKIKHTSEGDEFVAT